MDFNVSRVAVGKPRASAAATRSAVNSGHLIWTKWTSSAASIPASSIAARTPVATASTCASRPRCSWGNGGVRERPIASAPGASGSSELRASNTRKCGANAPSVPPDMTIQGSSASASSRCTRKASCSARVAKPREKSLTRPLPSVLPKTATTAFPSIAPSRMRASSPETSSGALAEMRCTNARRVTAGSRSRPSSSATAPNTPPCIVTILIAAS